MKEEKEIMIPAVPTDSSRFEHPLYTGESSTAQASPGLPGVQKQDATPNKEEQNKEDWALQDKLLKTTCTLALILWVIAIAALSIMTDSSLFNTFLGLLPFILTLVVSYILVDRYHMESGFLMVFPFIFTGMFLVMGFGGLLGDIDYKVLSVVNIVAGLFFEAILVMQHSFITKHGHLVYGKKKEETEEKEDEKETDKEKEKEEKSEIEKKFEANTTEFITEKTIEHNDEIAMTGEPAKTVTIRFDDEGISSFVSNIEDKAKAINAVIGRVYSVRRGGTEGMRKVIRIDPSHYNEFNDLKDQKTEKRKKAAIVLLKKIHDTLKLLEKAEIDVFEKEDLTGLLKLNREPHGDSRIIDVLIKNDSDPVKQYYDSAREFCENALKELGYEEEKKMEQPAKTQHAETIHDKRVREIVIQEEKPQKSIHTIRKEMIKKKLAGKKIKLKKR